LEDYTRYRDEHQVVVQTWKSTETMLQNKIAILDSALETSKDEISRSFVEGFNRVVEQIKTINPNIDTSPLDPFKGVVDGQIMMTNRLTAEICVFLKKS